MRITILRLRFSNKQFLIDWVKVGVYFHLPPYGGQHA